MATLASLATLLIAMAIVVEFLVERTKAVVPALFELKYVTPTIISFIYALAVTFMFKLDFFEVLSLHSSIPVLPQIFTALSISAGADPLHNAFSKLRESRGLEDENDV